MDQHDDDLHVYSVFCLLFNSSRKACGVDTNRLVFEAESTPTLGSMCIAWRLSMDRRRALFLMLLARNERSRARDCPIDRPHRVVPHPPSPVPPIDRGRSLSIDVRSAVHQHLLSFSLARQQRVVGAHFSARFPPQIIRRFVSFSKPNVQFRVIIGCYVE
ncbi:hypothetical protein KIN20_011672 [Parelaphostrongylus tenuis]|uniref:Uncharacterized protein n=1 Tax=Parelaphostrongylus tenuis TaxID=148309 RepID=A0AAD5N0G7_PARTN|nr:hypothetical protein KIN20_011672 [Parelaphostrongylus tenuis]KAJ1354675.1 hypothetical protein KIN20_011672 [Parelaphostrongylus tenuis]